ncbi:MAG TPA: threonine/serine exporter family protein [Magnetospirillum sp.]|nr:threonine/serine exporter family protein [Magnetospirillum sp.]
MTVDMAHLAHQALFGAVAAAGFGVLFNFELRALPWCAAAGAVALFVRTLGLDAHMSLEAASFVAATVVGLAVRLLLPRQRQASSAMALAGCIPMVPGSFFAQAILGLLALTTAVEANAAAMIATTLEYTLRVLFTVGAIGTGLTIPTHLLGNREF